MKEIVLFVPTRGSEKRLHKTAKQYEELDKVVFLATNLESKSFIGLPKNCEVVDLGNSGQYSLLQKRNLAAKMAEEMGLTYCLQSDDDLSSRGKYPLAMVATKLVEKLDEYPYLGAASSYGFSSIALGQVPTPVSHEFVLKNFPSLLFALRLEAFRQTEGFRLGSMEDVDIGCQLWEQGWIVAGFPELTWNHTRARRGKKLTEGGMPNSELLITLPQGIETMKAHAAVKNITYRVLEDGFCKQHTYWNWSYFLERMRSVQPTYADSRFVN